MSMSITVAHWKSQSLRVEKVKGTRRRGHVHTVFLMCLGIEKVKGTRRRGVVPHVFPMCRAMQPKRKLELSLHE